MSMLHFIFCVVTKKQKCCFLQESGQEHSKLSGSSSFNASPMRQTSTPVNASPPKCTTPEKVVKLSFPEYVLHTDTELEQVRQQYFELAKTGKQRNCQMSKDLRCRLIRNTMTSMIAILRAKGDRDSHRYPSKPEITAMAKRIVLYYPMLQDQGHHTWVSEMHPVDDCFILDIFSSGLKNVLNVLCRSLCTHSYTKDCKM